MKKTLTLLIYFLFITQSFAQNLKLDNILNIQLKNTGEILSEEKNVIGYFFFYLVDSKDKVNNTYILKVTDENLREINSLDLIKPRATALVEANYNGNAFIFSFYDPKMKMNELVTYDKSLKQLGAISNSVEDHGPAQSIYNYQSKGNSLGYTFLYPVANTGFLNYGYIKNNKTKYIIDRYSNDLKLMWSVQCPDIVTDVYDEAQEAFQTRTTVVSLISRRKEYYSYEGTFNLLINDLATGKELENIAIKDDQYILAPAKINYLEASNEILVFGEYFKGKIEKGKTITTSTGYFSQLLDMKGNVIKKAYYEWEKDLAKLVSYDDKKEVKEGKKEKPTTFYKTYDLYTHNMIKTSDGDFIIIGEQYSYRAGPSSPGSKNISTFFYTKDIFALTLNSALEIKSTDLFDKRRSEHSTTGDITRHGRFLPIIAITSNWFDYGFTQLSKDKKTFSIAYTDYVKEKGEKGKIVLGVITYTPEKTFVTDKTDLNRTSSNYIVRKGKSGYIFVGEYFKEEKYIDYRLEKINY
ncbi:MAG: hypothetical protein H7282_02505 [Cytophagaceae bacterium]|nr:hypothetical protein [Cytophagaceae bacterium]